MSAIQDNIESLPFYDYVVDKWNEYAGDKFQTKDPYVEETADGKTRKLKLPEYCSKEDQKAYKNIQKKAWRDDKCFMGCYPVDCGIGAAPILSLIPAIGPILMYAIHARLIHYADQKYHLGAKTVAKLELNILFDFLITLPPVIGSFLSFLNGCSTRNAAIIYNTVSKRAYELHRQDPNFEQFVSQQPAPSKFNKFMSKFENQQQPRQQPQQQGVYR